MAFYIGNFYISKRDIFLVLAALLLGLAMVTRYELPFFSVQNLLVLTVLILLTKGLLLPTQDSTVYVTFLTAVIMTLFFPLVQVLLFLFISFILLHVVKVI